MRAAILKDIGLVEVKDVSLPELEPNEVLVKVAVAGICGSDVHGFSSGLYEVGIIMGHEFSGTVENVGVDVTRFKKGYRVTAHPILPCGSCTFCKSGKVNLCDDMGTIGITHSGAFAEYIKVPERNLYNIGDTDFSKVAFTEPLSVVLRSYYMSGVQTGDKVLIIGGGTIGNLLMRVLKLKGIHNLVLSEPNDFRREIGARYGYSVFNPLITETMDFCEKSFAQLPDVVFECVGIPETIQEAVQDVSKGGKVIVLGVSTEPVEMDFLDIMYNEKSIRAVYSCADEFTEALELIKSGKIDPLDIVTSEISLSEISDKGLGKLMGEHQEIKILVRPD